MKSYFFRQSAEMCLLLFCFLISILQIHSLCQLKKLLKLLGKPWVFSTKGGNRGWEGFLFCNRILFSLLIHLHFKPFAIWTGSVQDPARSYCRRSEETLYHLSQICQIWKSTVPLQRPWCAKANSQWWNLAIQ